jgi:hypothetical protein
MRRPTAPRVLGRLDDAARAVGSARPRVWIFVYVGMLLGFAGGYALLPAGNFHDSNIGSEAAFERDATGLAQALSAEIRAGARPSRWLTRVSAVISYRGTPRPKTPRVFVRLRAGEPRVITIRHTADGRLLLLVTGSYAPIAPLRVARSARFDTAGVFEEWVQVFLSNAVFFGHSARTPAEVAYRVERASPEGGQPVAVPPFPEPPFSLLFPRPAGMGELRAAAGILLVHDAVASRLGRWFNAAEGDPAFASGRWWRMLYFSATTVTTLGPGDITPTSSLARILVGLESVGGILVIGFFLNALAVRIRRREPET